MDNNLTLQFHVESYKLNHQQYLKNIIMMKKRLKQHLITDGSVLVMLQHLILLHMKLL